MASRLAIRRHFTEKNARRRRLALLLTLACLGAVAPVNAAEWRAFWVDAWGEGFLNQSQVDTLLGVPGTTNLGRIREVNCNAVVVQVRRRFDVCYPSGVGEPYMSGLSPANFNALAAMIKAAHDTTGGKKRIEVHCWSVVFKTGKGLVYSQHTNPPTGSTTNFDNYWPTRKGSVTGPENSDGAFDPGHPKVLEYLVNAHMDLVNFQTVAGPDGTDGHIDGIHYDYIRFEADDEGFNPTSVARYKERYGLTSDPVYTDELFKQWRRDQVTAFVRQMYARIQKTKPWIKQSGAFVTWNPSPTASTRAAFQNTRPYYQVYSDWDSWVQEGIVDMAIPMTYYNWASLPSDYVRWMNFEKDRKGNRHMIVGPGIYLNSLDNAILELQMTRDPSPAGNNAHGFCGYSYRVPYSGGTWTGFAPSLKANVTPTWDDIPEMPWKTAPTNGHLMGVVTLAGTGAWADHAIVRINGPVNRTNYVDGTGFYAFIDLPPGSYTVTASKAGYADAQTNVTIALGQVTGNMFERNLVLGVASPPVITAHPQDLVVAQGSNATFSVSATGQPPLAFQWRFFGTNLPGATTSTFTRTNAQPAHEGPYLVVVTNALGSVTSSVATLTIIVPPTITSHPVSLAVTQGMNATFTVSVSGTAPFGYQWRFNGTNLPGATQSVFTLTNAQPSHAGLYSVVVSNFAGIAVSSNALLTVYPAPVPPSILVEPLDQTVYAGQTATFNVVASGAEPLGYQWWFNDAPLPGATQASLTRAPAQTNHAGGYRVVVTNAYGAVTSRVAMLTVLPPCVPVGATPLWTLAPGSRPYLTFNSLPYERGMAYNPVSRRVLVVSRVGPRVFALDADTGADLHELNTNGISGGTYPLLMIGAADDGAVYAGNLTTAGTTTAFRLYRWANDDSNTVPTLAYSGDPGAGNNQRWGDTLDVRGAGTNTQILIASRSGNVVALFTTTNGTTFTPRLITVADAPTGAFGLGIAFGAGNTFWGKATSQNLRQVAFDLVAGSGTTIRNHASPGFPANVAPIGVSVPLNLLGGIVVGTTGNEFRLYDLTPTNGTPVALATNAFATDNDNSQTGTGSVDFSPDRVYVLGANNGLLALQIDCAPVAVPPAITAQPASQTVNQGGNATFTVTATGTEPLAYQWWFNQSPLAGATNNSFTRVGVQPEHAGDYFVVITNAVGAVTSAVATLTVIVPPSITSHPAAQTVLRGGTASFSVVATGTPPLFYQWYFNDLPLANATNSSLAISNAQPSDAGEYFVEVLNAAGSAISSNALLTVLVPQPARFEGISPLPDGRMRLVWRGEPGLSYWVQAATNVDFQVWTLLGPISGSNGWFEFVDADATNLLQRFYRTLEP